MSSALDDYNTEVDNITDAYRRLSKINPKHPYLDLVKFDTDGALIVKDEFWAKFEPTEWKEEKNLFYKLHCLSNANTKLEEVLTTA